MFEQPIKLPKLIKTLANNRDHNPVPFDENESDVLLTLEEFDAKYKHWLYRSGYLYLVWNETFNIYKIGITRDVRTRMRHIALPMNVFGPTYLIWYAWLDDVFIKEAWLHTRFQNRRYAFEWFNLLPWDIDVVKGLAI